MTVLGEVPVVVPVATEGLLAALGLVAFLGFIVATGMLKAYAHSIGYLIRWLAQNIDVGVPTGVFGRLHPLRPIARGLEGLDGTIRNELAALALGYEITAAWAFAQAGAIFRWVGDEIGGLAYDVAQSFSHVTGTVIPQAVLDAEHRAAQRLRGLEVGIDRVRARLADDLARLQVGIDRVSSHLEHTIARDSAAIRSRVIGLEHGVDVTERRVRSLERRFGVRVFAGAVAVALARLGLGWLRCRNLRTVGRRVCGLDPSLLDELLLGTVAVLGTLSVVEYAKELEQASDELVALLRLGIREMRVGDPLELSGSTFPH